LAEKNKETEFENKCNILAELWMSYRFDKKFSDFVEYNDIGLPLAFLVAEDLVKPAALAKSMLEETFDLLLASLNVEDSGFESLDDVFVG
jgi:hypothetical protein